MRCANCGLKPGESFNNLPNDCTVCQPVRDLKTVMDLFVKATWLDWAGSGSDLEKAHSKHTELKKKYELD